MARYCDDADVYATVRSGSLPNEARLCRSARAVDDTFECDGHGLSDDDLVSFRAEDCGVLPSGIEAGVTYYALPLSGSLFQVAATAGGAAVTLETDGDQVLLVREMPMGRWIEWASAEVDQMLTAHPVELDEDAVPTMVRAVTARLAAYQARVWSGRQVDEDLAALLDETRKQLGRWARGVPLRGANRPASANLSVSGSASSSDVRGSIP